MTTAKSINLYIRQEKTQKILYAKSLERMPKQRPSVKKHPTPETEQLEKADVDQQLDLFRV